MILEDKKYEVYSLSYWDSLFFFLRKKTPCVLPVKPNNKDRFRHHGLYEIYILKFGKNTKVSGILMSVLIINRHLLKNVI